MRVLFVNYEFPPLGGGGGTTCKYLAKALADKGVLVTVFTAGFRGLPAVEQSDGYEIRRIRCARSSESRCTPLEMASFVLLAAIPLLRLVRSTNPDILHVFFAMPTGPLGWLVRRVTGKPYLLYLLGGDVPGFLDDEIGWLHRLLHGVSRTVWGSAARVIANSEGLRRLGNTAFPDIPIDVVTNGIDTNDFRPSNDRPSKEGLSLLFVGRLVDQKGLQVLLEVLARLVVSGRSDISLCVVGEGPKRPLYERYAAGHGLGGLVEFVGWEKLDELKKRYTSADVFVLPSTFEGMASVVLQAMACGLPVVSTRVFGSEDLVVDGVNGCLVEVGDVAAMAERIDYLAEHAKERRAMGKRARETVLPYHWSSIADRIIALSDEAARR